MRIAFTGASGTGKTTLTEYLGETYNLEYNPIGSRSVAASMGFDSPYDVDAAGKRVEFQQRLVTDKARWEEKQEEFVTDRTTFDNLAYATIHCIEGVDDVMLDLYLQGMKRYTHIFYCPESEFIKIGDDPHRRKERAYHKVHDAVLQGLLTKYGYMQQVTVVRGSNLESRKQWVRQVIEVQRGADIYSPFGT